MEQTSAQFKSSFYHQKCFRFFSANQKLQQQGQGVLELSLCLLILSLLIISVHSINLKIEKGTKYELQQYQRKWNRIQSQTSP